MSEKLLNILQNTELLLTHRKQEEWLQWTDAYRSQNIFFGVGLMTSTALSSAVPFDILSMFFLSELLRKIVDGQKVFVLVADQHAITNQLVSLDQVQERTQQILATLSAIIKIFGLSHFELIQTTPLNFDERIKKIYRTELPAMENDYVKHEIADTLWLQRHHGVGIKLGWAMSTEQSVQGHDERFFDSQIAEFVTGMSFIHAKPGRTANPERQRVSPYVSIAGEDRLVVTHSEDAVSKISRWRQESTNPATKPLLRHLSQIIRLHDRLFTPVMAKSLEEKVQKIMSKVAIQT